MSTKNLVPRHSGEGGIGKIDKAWATGVFDNLVLNNLSINGNDLKLDQDLQKTDNVEFASGDFSNGLTVRGFDVAVINEKIEQIIDQKVDDFVFFARAEDEDYQIKNVFYDTPSDNTYLSGVNFISQSNTKLFLQWEGPPDSYFGSGFIQGQQIPEENISEVYPGSRKFQGFLNVNLAGLTGITGEANGKQVVVPVFDLGSTPTPINISIDSISNATPNSGEHLGETHLKQGDKINIFVDFHEPDIEYIKVFDYGAFNEVDFKKYNLSIHDDFYRATIPVEASSREGDLSVAVQAINSLGITGELKESSDFSHSNNSIKLDQSYPEVFALSPAQYNGRIDGLRENETTTFSNNVTNWDQHSDIILYTPLNNSIEVLNREYYETNKPVLYNSTVYNKETKNLEIYAQKRSNGRSDKKSVCIKIANAPEIVNINVNRIATSCSEEFEIGSSQVKAGDIVDATVEIDGKGVSARELHISVLKKGMSDGTQSAFLNSYDYEILPNGNFKFSIPVKIFGPFGDPQRNGERALHILAKNNFEIFSDETVSNDTVYINNTSIPSIIIDKISYPLNQSAIKNQEFSEVENIVENFTSIEYKSNGQLSIENPTTYETFKKVHYLSGDYNIDVDEGEDNFTILAKNVSNGTKTEVSKIVNIANKPVEVYIENLQPRLRSTPEGFKENFMLSTDQIMLEPPLINLDLNQLNKPLLAHEFSGVGKSSNFLSITVFDTTTKGSFNWDISARNLANIETKIISRNPTYTIEGFYDRKCIASPRDLGAGIASIGSKVTTPERVLFENLSEGTHHSNNENDISFTSKLEQGKTEYTIDFPEELERVPYIYIEIKGSNEQEGSLAIPHVITEVTNKNFTILFSFEIPDESYSIDILLKPTETDYHGGMVYSFQSIDDGILLNNHIDIPNKFSICNESGVTKKDGDYIFNLDKHSRSANCAVLDPASFIIAENPYKPFFKSNSDTIFIPENPSVETNLTATANIGESKLEIESQEHFNIGDQIIISEGTDNEETNKIVDFGSFILETPLKYTHAQGTFIKKIYPATKVNLAEDIDTGNLETKYYIDKASQEFFSINESTGELTLKFKPDYESGITSIPFTLTVSNQMESINRLFTVKIVDIVDIPPAWNNSNEVIFIKENISSVNYESFLSKGQTGTTFSLDPQSALKLNIDPNLGTLQFKQPPDYETDPTFYNITIIASNDAGSSELSINLFIQNAVEIHPSWEQNSETIYFPEGTLAVDITTALTQGDGNLTYVLAGIDTSYFNFDETTGLISFKEAPDFESDKKSFSISLIASNEAGSDQLNLNIQVINVPDTKPTWAQNTEDITIQENSSFISYTTELDPGDDTPFYQLDGADKSLFSINENTGSLNLNNPADYETKPEYQVTVVALNGAGSDNLQLKITVTDVADTTPEWNVSSETVFIQEGSTNITYSSYLNKGDGIITYSLSGEEANLFNINQSTGQINFLQAPDYETKQSYEVSIVAQNAVGSSELKLIIQITNIGDIDPQWEYSTETLPFSENNIFLSFSALTTLHPGDSQVTYSILGVDSSSFTVNSSTGVLTFKERPDYESGKTSYEVDLKATNSSGESVLKLTIPIINTADVPPTWQEKNTTLSIAESSTNLTLQPSVLLNPGDSDVTYSLSGADQYYFTFNQNTIEITFKDQPDYETKSIYSISIIASNDAGSDALNVTINILNNPDVAPSWDREDVHNTWFSEENTDLSLAINETLSPGDSPVTYTLTGTDAASFSVDPNSGAIEFVNAPDYETKTTYEFSLRASNQAGYDDLAIKVFITDVEDLAPSWPTSSKIYTVNESTSELTIDGAQDLIPGDDYGTAQFSLSGTDSDKFLLNTNTGLITFKNQPDYETQQSFSFILTVGNSVGSAPRNITINITNTEDTAPSWSSSSETINFAENSSNLTLTLNSTLNPGDSAVTYSISGTDSSSFNIDSSTGAISFKQQPDYESGKLTYNLDLKAANNSGESNLNITVNIQNIFDVSPTWQDRPYNISVSENTTMVLDYGLYLDEGDSACTVTIGGVDASLFSINTTDKTVSFVSAPDYEVDRKNFNITLTATNTAGSATIELPITVMNITESYITWEYPDSNYPGETLNINEGTKQVNYQSTLNKYDADIIYYSIVDSPDAEYFEIDPLTGALSFKDDSIPDYESYKLNYNINIQANAGTHPDGQPNTANLNISINILDVNDTPPEWYGESIYNDDYNPYDPGALTEYIDISEGFNEGFIFKPGATNSYNGVSHAQAMDLDDPNTQLTYSIGAEYTGNLFSINSETGEINFKTPPWIIDGGFEQWGPVDPFESGGMEALQLYLPIVASNQYASATLWFKIDLYRAILGIQFSTGSDSLGKISSNGDTFYPGDRVYLSSNHPNPSYSFLSWTIESAPDQPVDVGLSQFNDWGEINTEITGSEKGSSTGRKNALGFSEDGSVAVLSNDLAIYAYENKTTGSWKQLGSAISASVNQLFGSALALSSDGNVIAFQEGDYVKVYAKNDIFTDWTQIGQAIEATAGYYGQITLNSNGTIIAIGQSLYDGIAGGNSGRTSIFHNTGVLAGTSSTQWTKIGNDIEGASVGDYSGYSVAINSSAQVNQEGTIVAIGSWYANNLKGHVRVFKYTENQWNLIQTLVPTFSNYRGTYGTSVDMNSDGSIIAVGEPLAGKGRVWVYQKEENAETYAQLGSEIEGEIQSGRFGEALSLSSDGLTLACAAPWADAGVTSIFKYESDSWTQSGSDIPGKQSGEKSGSSVKLSGDGKSILIGAPDFKLEEYIEAGDYSRGVVRTYSSENVYSFTMPKHSVIIAANYSLFGLDSMIYIEPGSYLQGSPENEYMRDHDEVQRQVTITKGFYLGKFEVTQAQWEAVMTGNTNGISATPSTFNGHPNRPVETVSWDEVQVFLARLNEQLADNIPDGWTYKLPSAAEWEYACRAGTTTAYWWGNTIDSSNANYNYNYPATTTGATKDVGSYAPNPWGLYDMHGNLTEVTNTAHVDYDETPVTDPDPQSDGGIGNTSRREIKGGSYATPSWGLRAAERSHLGIEQDYKVSTFGFRLALKQVS